jgi:hypothetical protein
MKVSAVTLSPIQRIDPMTTATDSAVLGIPPEYPPMTPELADRWKRFCEQEAERLGTEEIATSLDEPSATTEPTPQVPDATAAADTPPVAHDAFHPRWGDEVPARHKAMLMLDDKTFTLESVGFMLDRRIDPEKYPVDLYYAIREEQTALAGLYEHLADRAKDDDLSWTEQRTAIIGLLVVHEGLGLMDDIRNKEGRLAG